MLVRPRTKHATLHTLLGVLLLLLLLRQRSSKVRLLLRRRLLWLRPLMKEPATLLSVRRMVGLRGLTLNALLRGSSLMALGGVPLQ